MGYPESDQMDQRQLEADPRVTATEAEDRTRDLVVSSTKTLQLTSYLVAGIDVSHALAQQLTSCSACQGPVPAGVS